MRNEKFKPIEARLSAFVSNAGEEIDAEFENLQCAMDVYYPPNDKSEYGYFGITLECLLHKVDFDNTDCAYLQIGIDDHAGRFNINADMGWGYPFAKTIFRVFPEDVPVSEENLTIIENSLPILLSKLKDELRENPKGKAPEVVPESLKASDK